MSFAFGDSTTVSSLSFSLTEFFGTFDPLALPADSSFWALPLKAEILKGLGFPRWRSSPTLWKQVF